MRVIVLVALLVCSAPLFVSSPTCLAQSQENRPGAESQGPGSEGACPAAEAAAAAADAAAPPDDPSSAKRVKALAFLGGLRRHYSNPVNFFEEFHGRHGPTFRVDLPLRLRLLFDSRQEAFSGTLLHTDFGDGSWEKPPLQGHGLSFLMGTDNVFLGSGDVWKQGHTAMKPYLDGKAINNAAAAAQMVAILDEHVASLKHRVSASPSGEIVVDVRRQMQLATLDVALRVLLGSKLTPDELVEIQHAFGTVMEWLPKETLNVTNFSLSRAAGIIPGARKLKDAYRTLHTLADRVIAERRASGSSGRDLLAGLLEARDPVTGAPFDHRRLRNEILTIILAGHETTATLLSWTLVIMARHPAEYSKLRSGVDALGPGVPEVSALRRVAAIEDVVKETLRLYTPAYFLVRRATRDTKLGPPQAAVTCPKGTTAVMSSYHAHRNEANWGVDKTGFPAEEFHPERFQKTTPKMYPFGAGVRVCLGQHMARLEASLMLARFAQTFDVSPASDAPLEVASDVSVHPRDGRVRLRLRNPDR